MANGTLACGLELSATLPGSAHRDDGRSSQATGASDRRLLERFSREKDEVAFEALVRRHGPMVLGVCQRILNHPHDAEDAFQATFLVLVRKAGSLDRPDSLANWLYGVAYRTATKARTNRARRRQHERQVLTMPAVGLLADEAWRDLCGVLDDELQRLPHKYRAPLVLCYLEGKTNEQAARELGWPPGSISARLARGRALLRERLAGPLRPRATRRHRGATGEPHPSMGLPAAVFTLALEQHAAAVALPGRLVEATVAAALGAAGPQGLATGLASPSAATLARATLETLRSNRLRWLTGTLLVLALAGLSAGALAVTAGTRGTGDAGLHEGSPPPPIAVPCAPCHPDPAVSPEERGPH